jgi:ribonuclease J
MNFKIHRGANEIGGTCVEVWTNTTRIVIDFGMPLVNPDKTPFDERETENRSTTELIEKGVIPNIPSLFQDNSNSALLISHAHKDHYGLMDRINPSCHVWMGYATHLLIELTNTFGDKPALSNVNYFEHDKEFKIGDITIRPFLMDHAAFDAYAFLIKANGKSLIYSGDFRLHGRKSKIFDWFSYKIEKNVDYLLLEGSAIGRTDEPFPTETELENAFVDTFKQTKGINLIFVSGQNIDRLVSIYNACKRTKKTLLIDFYIAKVLDTLHKKANSKRIPFPCDQSFPEIKVYYPYWLTKRMKAMGKEAETIFPFTKYKISKNELDEKASDLVMIVRPSTQSDLERYLHKYENGHFIYSMWEGYKDLPGNIKDFLDFIASKGMPIKDIHTSGHADLDGLRKMVDAVNP